MRYALIICGLWLTLSSCIQPPSTDSISDEIISGGSESGSNVFAPVDDKKRMAWQKPEMVIDRLGNLAGKTVADIGAGTGYFTFRLANKADHVIAIDIDPDALGIIEGFINLDSSLITKIETRLAKPDDPMLKEGETDLVVIINTIGFIPSRSDYLARLRRNIREDGQIMIVDFKMKRIPPDIGTPPEKRVSILQMENELEDVGYSNIRTDDVSLDYQYIILADR